MGPVKGVWLVELQGLGIHPEFDHFTGINKGRFCLRNPVNQNTWQGLRERGT